MLKALKVKIINRKYFFLALILLGMASPALAAKSPDAEEIVEKQYDATATTMHHLLDSYSWEFFKWDGEYVALHLPRILYNTKDGRLDFYGSTHSAEEAGYVDAHHYDHDKLHGALFAPGFGQAYEQLEASGLEPGSTEFKEQYKEIQKEYRVWDFSITKNVTFMILISLIMLAIFIPMAGKYKKNPNSAPKGIQSFFEPIVVFIRDDIGKQNIPHHYERFMPLLCTLFFFIWFLNLSGLVPFGSNATGNISVTLALALITLVVTHINAKPDYWKHIFWFPGVPIPMKLLMFIVEFIGIFTKPFALMVRLFANITAGHVIVLSLIGLIFILGKMGANPVGGWGASVISTLFILFIDLIELFVALLQAYVFTLLSAVFIGQALEEHHHEDHAKEHDNLTVE